MALSKIIYQDSCEELVRAAYANGEMLSTLIDYDTGVKKASSSLVSKQLLEEFRPADKNTACIHLIAMGDSDQYGFNRNGDYFAGDVLEKRSHTFVTNGHVFREHNNKDPKKALGHVKWAGYDPHGMHRVELIVHIDKDKAEKEYEMAKEGKALNFSMACKVPNDRCSCCGNEAKRVADYCDHLRNRMGQYIEPMQKYAFAYNDNPTFFDLSIVKCPADRIARHLEYSFSKAASAKEGVPLKPSAVEASELGINLDSLSIDEQNMLYKLAETEAYRDNWETTSRSAYDSRAYTISNVAPYALEDKLSQTELNLCRSLNPGTLFYELNKRASILSFPAFCQYITGDVNADTTPIYKQAACILPHIFSDILPHILSMTSYTPCFEPSSRFMAESDMCNHDSVQKVMDGIEDKFSMKEEPVKTRVTAIIIKKGSFNKDVSTQLTKSASSYIDPAAKELANAYGQYTIRALCDLKETYGDNVYNLCDVIVGSNIGLSVDN